MTVGQLKAVAAKHTEDLQNFRLSGKLSDLIPFIRSVLQEDKQELPQLYEYKCEETVMEHKALVAIIDEIGEEGNVSIVKLIQKSNVSRPVFTSLFNKLEKYKIAATKNQGVKGMHIRFAYDLTELRKTKDELYREEV